MPFNLPLPVKIFATQGTREIAENIYEAARPILGRVSVNNLHLGASTFTEFSNQNILCKIDNVRDNFAVVIHTQTPPVDRGMIELFNLLDAIINARAIDILLVFPYMPYVRSDRKNQPRISVMAKCLADIISTSFQIKRVILLDPHDSHIKHYFKPAADEITALYLITDYIERELFKLHPKDEYGIAFPDAGAAKRFENVAKILDLPTAYIDKGRSDNTENPEIKEVVGNVDKKRCLLFDDEILTGSTSTKDAKTLKGHGAIEVYAVNIHGTLADKNIPPEEFIRQKEESVIDRFIVTDSVPVRHKITSLNTKFTVLSVYPLLAQAIVRTVCNQSLTELHEPKNAHFYRSF
jgi:ribose-phosphate pyrophosphokinase